MCFVTSGTPGDTFGGSKLPPEWGGQAEGVWCIASEVVNGDQSGVPQYVYEAQPMDFLGRFSTSVVVVFHVLIPFTFVFLDTN